jgi:O-antigen/teichoic acid export membrane protein
LNISTVKPFKQRVIKAGIWIFSGHVTAHIIRLVSNLIMTRLLVPEMFGLMSIVSVLMVGLTLFSDLGLRQSIIQSKNGQDEAFLNTVWSLQVLRGFVLWGISALFAVGIYVFQVLSWMPHATVYAEPLLPYIIPVSTLSMIIVGFEPTWTGLASRNLQQSKLVKIELISQVSGVIVMVIFALFSRSIWALVLGSLCSSLVRCLIVNFIIKEFRNQFAINKGYAREILHFGKWIFLSSIIGFLAMNGDKILLGGLITTEELGVYNIAAFMVGAASTIVSRLLGGVAYPALSETVRDKPYDLQRVYYRFRIPFDAGIMFLAGFLFMSGNAIINVLYDARYIEAGWMLSVLGLSLIALRYNLADQSYMAMGKPKLMTTLTLIRTTALFVLLPLGFQRFGLHGAIWAIVISYFSSFPMAIYYKKSHDLLDVKKELIMLPLVLVGIGFGFLVNQVLP